MASMDEEFYRRTSNGINDLRGLRYDSNNFEPDAREYPNNPLTSQKIVNEKIAALTRENEKLRKQYSDLIQKTNKLVAAYRELEIENKELKTKNNKRDSVVKTVENTKNFFKNIWNNFIDWLST